MASFTQSTISSRSYIKFISYVIFCLFVFLSLTNSQPASASSSVKIGCHSQGATVTEKYFFFTNWCHNDNARTGIYRCDRSGVNISHCKRIVYTVLKHANALQYNWGYKHFWVFDEGNPIRGGFMRCYDFSGKQIKKKAKQACGPRPNNNTYHNRVPGTSQGYALYGNYFLKGSWKPNTITVFKKTKKGEKKKTISGLASGELEDVSVDGDTGYIYYTTSDNGRVTLHRVPKSKYILPKAYELKSGTAGTKKTSSSKKSTSVKKTSSKSSSSTDPNQRATTSYDGTVETIILDGSNQDDGSGCGVYSVLNFIINLLTFGIGIAAAISIAVSGVLFLTARDNAAQATKAKTRIFQTIIGLAIYAVLWSITNWLLPGGLFNNQCSSTDSDSSSAVPITAIISSTDRVDQHYDNHILDKTITA